MEFKVLLGKIKNQKFINQIKIIWNIIVYLFLKILSKEKSTERLLLKKLSIKCKIDGHKINYYFELLTFLNNFETQEYLNMLLDKNHDIIIDIWSNIWRISWMSILHSKNSNIAHILCDPNPYVFNLSKHFYTSNIQKYKQTTYFINNAISDTKATIPFYIIEWNELNWVSSLHAENISSPKVKKILVESIPFKEVVSKIDMTDKQILVKVDVEWHEDKVLKSIIDFFGKSNIYDIELLVEIRDKNVKDILDIIKHSWYLQELKKISYNDYFIKLRK